MHPSGRVKVTTIDETWEIKEIKTLANLTNKLLS